MLASACSIQKCFISFVYGYFYWYLNVFISVETIVGTTEIYTSDTQTYSVTQVYLFSNDYKYHKKPSIMTPFQKSMAIVIFAGIFSLITAEEGIFFARCLHPIGHQNTMTCFPFSESSSRPYPAVAHVWEVYSLPGNDTCYGKGSSSYQKNVTCFEHVDVDSTYFQQVFPRYSAECCDGVCKKSSNVGIWCEYGPVTYTHLVSAESSSSAPPRKAPTNNGKPIAAKIVIEDNRWPRRETIRKALKQWSKVSGFSKPFNSLRYTVKKKNGRRYVVTFRYKNLFKR